MRTDWRHYRYERSNPYSRTTFRQTGMPATFVYARIYNNNFTSLPCPLFRLDLQVDGSFVWQAPFHPDDHLPLVDAEHDVGPLLLQILKMGLTAWQGRR